MSGSDLGRGSVLRLIVIYSIPSVLSNLVNSLYNIADRYFIGKYAGEDSFAALTMAFPVMLLFVAAGTLVAVGGVALITVMLGGKDMDRANEAYGNLITVIGIVSGFVAILVFVFAGECFTILGATDEVIVEGKKYMKIIALGVPFQMYAYTLGSLLRSEGRPNLAMISVFVSGFSNIILDYQFVAVFGYGVSGAAIGTVIAQFLGFLIPLYYFMSKRCILKLHTHNLYPRWKNIKVIFEIGSSSFALMIGKSIGLGLYSGVIMFHGGTAAVAALGAVSAIESIAFMPLLGMQQGLQPLIGYNYGAGKYIRAKQFALKGIVIGALISTSAVIVILLFPELFLSIFIEKSSETLSVAVNGMKHYVLGLPILSAAIIGITYFQSTMRPGIALFLGVSRYAFVMAPLLFILPVFFGLNGAWAVMSVSDFSLSVITFILMIVTFKKKKTAIVV